MENKCDYLYSAFYSQQLNLKQDNIFKIFNASLFAFTMKCYKKIMLKDLASSQSCLDLYDLVSGKEANNGNWELLSKERLSTK